MNYDFIRRNTMGHQELILQRINYYFDKILDKTAALNIVLVYFELIKQYKYKCDSCYITKYELDLIKELSLITTPNEICKNRLIVSKQPILYITNDSTAKFLPKNSKNDDTIAVDHNKKNENENTYNISLMLERSIDGINFDNVEDKIAINFYEKNNTILILSYVVPIEYYNINKSEIATHCFNLIEKSNFILKPYYSLYIHINHLYL